MTNENTEQAEKPFSFDYVARTTIKHMRKCVDTSIKKTMDRLPEFAGDQSRSQEVFKTLTYLHGMKKSLDEFQSASTNGK